MKTSAWLRSARLGLALASLSASAWAGSIEINEISMTDAPAWLKPARLQRVVDQVQDKLEWDIRKVRVTWYRDQASFQRLHGYGETVLAFTRPGDQSIHIGPRVDSGSFDSVMGHELGHVIVRQKYR